MIPTKVSAEMTNTAVTLLAAISEMASYTVAPEWIS